MIGWWDDYCTHVRQAHPLRHVPGWICPTCFARYDTLGERDRHARDCAAENAAPVVPSATATDWTCIGCRITFPSIDAYTRHDASCPGRTSAKPSPSAKTPNDFYICRRCSIAFHVLSAFQQHTKECPGPFELPGTQPRGEVTILANTGPGAMPTYRCNVCPSVADPTATLEFSTWDDWNAHAQTPDHQHRQCSRWPCGCRACPGRFETVSAFAHHVDLHHPLSPCVTCGATFPHVCAPTAAPRVVDRIAAERCPHCGTDIHASDLHHACLACPLCTARFKTENELEAHRVSIHQATALFACGECPALFRLERQLDVHVLNGHPKHSLLNLGGLRGWRCPDCGRIRSPASETCPHEGVR